MLKQFRSRWTYQTAAMNEFVFDDKRCTTNQLIRPWILDNCNIIAAAVFHFMETAYKTTEISNYSFDHLNILFLFSPFKWKVLNRIRKKWSILKKSMRDTFPMPVNCDSNCKKPRSKSPTCNGRTLSHGSPVFTAVIGGLNLVGVLLKSNWVSRFASYKASSAWNNTIKFKINRLGILCFDVIL